MKIKYQFVNETTEIEVSDEWGSVLLELDRQEYKNNRKETRRHNPLDVSIYENKKYAVDDEGLLKILGRNVMEDMLYQAIDTLTGEQKDLVQKIYFEDWSVNKYAEMLGVDASAVSHRIKRIKNKIKKFYADRQI